MISDPPPAKQIHVERNDLVVFHEHCPDRPYLELELPQDFHRAHSVKFTVESRDQGWTSERQAASSSWSDTCVRRPAGRSSLRTIRLFQNRAANPTFCEHSLEIIPNHPWGVNWKPWITSLQPGDVIELLPRAAWRGWLNIVRKARIELNYDSQDNSLALSTEEISFAFNAPLYRRPLDSTRREIRVLALYPGAFEDPIRCQVSHVQLDGDTEKQSPFDALSYSWGDNYDFKSIEVDTGSGSPSEIINITQSAEEALRHLRHVSVAMKIWIDVVSINQNDSAEKAQQVAMMAEIFSTARTVHVWLGLHPGIEAALLIIRDSYNYITRLCAGGGECQCDGSPHTALQDLGEIPEQHGVKYEHTVLNQVYYRYYNNFSHYPREYAGGTRDHHVSILMSHLFDNRWFRRMWVLQEVLRARTAVVHCGNETITWLEVTTINTWLEHPNFLASNPALLPSQVTMPQVWTDLANDRKEERGEQGDQGHPGVLDIYLDGLDLKSKEPRDKLFATLSFGKETSMGHTIPLEIRPQYDKAVELVFADFTRWWITEYNSLSILSYVHANRFRSWQRMLCDTTEPPTVTRPSWAIPSEGTRRWSRATLEVQFNFQAGAGTIPDAQLLKCNSCEEQNRLVLCLRGHQVGTIRKISRVDLETNYGLYSERQHTLLKVSQNIFDPVNIAGFWRTRRAIQRAISKADAKLELQDHLGSHRREDADREPAVILPFSTPKNSARKRSKPRQMGLESPVGSCTEPFYFTTSDGKTGLCPWRARKDDMIVLFFGANVPFLLRHMESDSQTSSERSGRSAVSDKLFELVGECYVFDIMDGELMQALQEREIAAEVFALV